MPQVAITSRAHFSSAHRLHSDAHDEEWNRRVFGKCANPNGHGHTYGLEVTVTGPVEEETGWVMDFAELKRIVSDRVVKVCDHKNLNTDVPFLRGVIPTAENIAIKVWDELAPAVAPRRLVRVILDETERNRVVYTGPGGT